MGLFFNKGDRMINSLIASDFEKIKDTIKQDMEKAIEKSRDDRER